MANEYDNDTENEKMWREYIKSRDSGLRERLILKYAYLVKVVAGRVSIHVGNHVDFEDMVSYGVFGLIDAVEKYDLVKGVKFETYASLRIRGSIIDYLRKLDWVPRTIRMRYKSVSKTYSDLENELGREPTDVELAERLGLSVSEVSEMVKKANVTTLISLDEYLSQNYETPVLLEVRQTDADASPERSFQQKETRRMLEDALSKLGDKEQVVLSMYYFDELTLKEISVVMGVSESRVSQIHSKAMIKLRARLDKQRELLFQGV